MCIIVGQSCQGSDEKKFSLNPLMFTALTSNFSAFPSGTVLSKRDQLEVYKERLRSVLLMGGGGGVKVR